MPVKAVEPNVNDIALLARAQFIDAYSVMHHQTPLTARQAAERMFAKQPRWIGILMTVRDGIVRLFGLKTEHNARASTAYRVGMFPVLSDTPQRLVAGLDDKHLDFRVIVDVASAGPSQRITATTIVLTHNRLGRAYLTIIMPFHRLVVRAMLRQVVD